LKITDTGNGEEAENSAQSKKGKTHCPQTGRPDPAAAPGSGRLLVPLRGRDAAVRNCRHRKWRVGGDARLRRLAVTIAV